MVHEQGRRDRIRALRESIHVAYEIFKFVFCKHLVLNSSFFFKMCFSNSVFLINLNNFHNLKHQNLYFDFKKIKSILKHEIIKEIYYQYKLALRLRASAAAKSVMISSKLFCIYTGQFLMLNVAK